MDTAIPRNLTMADRGITAIKVAGFKSLYEAVEIKINHLTILGGPNSSGKSSVVQPLLLLKQTLEASYDSGPLSISGPNIQFSNAHQFLSCVSPKRRVSEFWVEIETDKKSRLRFTYISKKDANLVLKEMLHTDKDGSVSLREGMSPDEIREELSNDKKLKGFVQHDSKFFEHHALEVLRRRCLLSIGTKQRILNNDKKNTGASARLSLDFTSDFAKRITELIHIPGLRGNPERAYPASAIFEEMPGLFLGYVASLVTHWARIEDNKLHQLCRNLHDLGLASGVATKRLDDIRVELQVGRLIDAPSGSVSDMVNIADVGFGVSQVLPVLVGLLFVETGQTIYIEQPELHLHPKAQVALAKIIAETSNRGVRVIVETHSSLLLLAMQQLVAEKKIDHKKISLNWFTRNPKNGRTTVAAAEIDELGRFGTWPVDFGEVELELHNEYLSTVERSRAD